MRLLHRYSAAILLGLGSSLAAQAQAAADEWFLQHDLFSVPVTRQSEARPGTLIALLPGGDIRWLHPADVISPEPMSFTVFSDESKKAVQVGVIAKFLSLGLAGQVKNSATLVIQQTNFKGTGYEDGPREDVILMKGTTVTDQFENIQDQFDKQNRAVPVYFVQKVFTTANLEVTNGRNLAAGGSVNATTPGSCTDVSAGGGTGAGTGSSTGPGGGTGTGTGGSTGTGGGTGTGTGGSTGTATGSITVTSNVTGHTAGAGSGTGSGTSTGTVTGNVTGAAAATMPGAGALFCYGKGDKDTLKANHDVPVAMSVCNVYYWEADHSWNCRPADKSIRFK